MITIKFLIIGIEMYLYIKAYTATRDIQSKHSLNPTPHSVDGITGSLGLKTFRGKTIQ